MYKVFRKLVSLSKLEKPARGELSTITAWLRERYIEYHQILLSFINHRKAKVQLPSVVLTLRLLKDDPLGSGAGIFPNDDYKRFVRALIESDTLSETIRSHFAAEYLDKYDDLRFHFCANLNKIMKEHRAADRQQIKTSTLRDNAIRLLSSLTKFPKDEESINEFWVVSEATQRPNTKSSVHSLSAHQRTFQDVWLSVLRYRLTPDQYKHVLSIMHARIIPNMPKPQLLMDFLTDSYNTGGAISLLSLNGLFYLMQHHNLEYPQFFEKLYALFDEELMAVRYRSRFFRLVDNFLSSSYVSSSLVASFIKRMSRLSLTAPPGAIVVLIPMTYNLLKLHPACMALIHRTDITHNTDPFKAEETDPSKTNAIESSLWELASLTDHFHPNVATLARILSEQFTKPSYNLEDFLDHNYTTMTDAEMKKRYKREVPTSMHKPTSLFMQAVEGDDLMAKVIDCK